MRLAGGDIRLTIPQETPQWTEIMLRATEAFNAHGPHTVPKMRMSVEIEGTEPMTFEMYGQMAVELRVDDVMEATTVWHRVEP